MRKALKHLSVPEIENIEQANLPHLQGSSPLRSRFHPAPRQFPLREVLPLKRKARSSAPPCSDRKRNFRPKSYGT